MEERRRRQRCVTCTPSEWRAIRAMARAAGMDISAYILSRVLDGEAPDGPPHPEAGYPLALTGAEQRRQLELLEQLVADSRRFLDAPFIPGTGTTLREAVAFLVLSFGAYGPVAEAGTENPTDGEHEAHPETSAESTPTTRTANEPDAVPPPVARPRQRDFLDELVADLNLGDGP